MGDSRSNCCFVDKVRWRTGADGPFSTAGLVLEERGGIILGGRWERPKVTLDLILKKQTEWGLNRKKGWPCRFFVWLVLRNIQRGKRVDNVTV